MVITQKRILAFSSAFLPQIGGAELALREIAERLKDWSFDLITHQFDASAPVEENIGRIHVFRVGNWATRVNSLVAKGLFSFYAYKKAKALMRAGNCYELLFALQASQGAGAAVMVKQWAQLPLVLNLQEGKELQRQKRLVRFLRKYILFHSDHIVTISQFLKQFVVAIGVSEKKITVIPNGVDVIRFSQEPSYGELMALRDILGIYPDEKVIISVSRLVEKNGIAILIAAFAQLVREKPQERYRLLLVGDGALRRSLEILVRNFGIASRVVFAGHVPHERLSLYLHLAHVFVRSSRSEGLGTAFLEAMAAGVPVIGTAVGGIVDFLVDPQQNPKHPTGILCQVDNPGSIVRAIHRLLNDTTLRTKVILNARKLVNERYTWDRIAEYYRAVLQACMMDGSLKRS